MRNRHEVALAVEYEGIGYFIQDYTSADEMPDKELEDAFNEALTALLKFESLLPILWN